MCPPAPAIPKPQAPPQEAKAPDSLADRRKARQNANSPTSLLTGPSGVQVAASNLGANTLLGG